MANIDRKDNPHEKLYLAEQLDVLSDQLYRHTLSAAGTSKMIEIAKKRPKANYRAIPTEGLHCLQLKDPDQRPPLLRRLDLFESFPNFLKFRRVRLPAPRSCMPPTKAGKRKRPL